MDDKKPKAQRIPANDRKELFAKHYATNMNATHAARAAGYSAHSAEQQGSALLKDPKVMTLIAKHAKKRDDKLEITGEKIIRELAKIAFANIGDIATWNANGWTWKDSEGLSEDQKACIQELAETTTESGGSAKVKMYDKLKALEMLGRWHELGLWADKLQVSRDPNDVPQTDEMRETLHRIKSLYSQLKLERGGK